MIEQPGVHTGLSDEEFLRFVVAWTLDRKRVALPVSDLWRVVQEYGWSVSYVDFELWLYEQQDMVEDAPSGGKRLCAGYRLIKGIELPEPGRVATEEGHTILEEHGSLRRLMAYAEDVVREEGKALYAYRETQNQTFNLTSIPVFTSPDQFVRLTAEDTPDFCRNLGAGKRAVYYGFPLLLDWVESRDGTFSDFKVVPVFVSRMEAQIQPDRTILQLEHSWPRLNPEIVSRSKPLDRQYLIQTLDAGEDAYESLESRIKLIASALPQYRVVDNISMYTLRPTLPLSTMNGEDSGIYNIGGIFLGGADTYTQGLIRELGALKQIREETLASTSLAPFVRSLRENQSKANSDNKWVPILPNSEGATLNLEQHSAVKRVQDHTLSIVTGPPGTGKSQVVLSLLATAALKGESVLFASKNRKAIQVVADRIRESTGSTRSLMLLGGEYDKETQANLANISNLPPRIDQTSRQEIELVFQEALDNLTNLDQKLDTIAGLELKKQEIHERLKEIQNDLLGKGNVIGEVDLNAIAGPLVVLFKDFNSLGNRLEQGPMFVCKWKLKKVSTKFSQQVEGLNQELASQQIPLVLKWPLHPEEIPAFRSMIFNLIDYLKLKDENQEVLDSLKKQGSPEALFEKIKESQQELSKLSSTVLKQRMQHISFEGDEGIELNDALLEVQNFMGPGRRRLENQNRRDTFAKAFRTLLNSLPCWAVTNLSACGRVPLSPNLFDLVVLDEASQCDILSSLPLLYRARRAVVIGDPMQLSQISKLSADVENSLLQHHQLTSSRYDHLHSSRNSLYDAARRVTPQSASTFLARHYRCHPGVINFANSAHWYDQRLEVFTDEKVLKRPEYWQAGIEWVDVSGPPAPQSKYFLPAEVQKVTELVGDLLNRQGYQGTVGVVSPFRLMADRIRTEVERTVDARFIQAASFESQTAHGFQGDERDVIFYAMGIHPEMPKGSSWFVAENSNLFNVALSRARAAFIVVGDQNAVSNFSYQGRPVSYLQDFMTYVDSLKTDDHSDPKTPSAQTPKFAPEQLWEKRFYEDVLLPLGAPVVSQYPLGPYKLDFALLRKGKSRKLDIEVDGVRWHQDSAGNRLRHDLDRDVYVRSQDGGQWDVMRFWVYEINENLEACKTRIQQWMNSSE
jgi:very-short-patch-repair endonuclease